jgi:hypothetical protein
LEAAFNRTHYPDVNAIDRLANMLNLTTERISVWFQNRRARYKKKKNSCGDDASKSFDQQPLIDETDSVKQKIDWDNFLQVARMQNAAFQKQVEEEERLKDAGKNNLNRPKSASIINEPSSVVAVTAAYQQNQVENYESKNTKSAIFNPMHLPHPVKLPYENYYQQNNYRQYENYSTKLNKNSTSFCSNEDTTSSSCFTNPTGSSNPSSPSSTESACPTPTPNTNDYAPGHNYQPYYYSYEQQNQHCYLSNDYNKPPEENVTVNYEIKESTSGKEAKDHVGSSESDTDSPKSPADSTPYKNSTSVSSPHNDDIIKNEPVDYGGEEEAEKQNESSASSSSSSSPIPNPNNQTNDDSDSTSQGETNAYSNSHQTEGYNNQYNYNQGYYYNSNYYSQAYGQFYYRPYEVANYPNTQSQANGLFQPYLQQNYTPHTNTATYYQNYASYNNYTPNSSYNYENSSSN